MDQNRYRPPRASLNPRQREPGSIPKAVVIGAIIDIGGTMIAAIGVVLIYAFMLGFQGYSETEIERALTEVPTLSPLWLILNAIGLAVSAFAGYQSAVIANRNNYLAPGLVSLVSVGFGALYGGQYEFREFMMLNALTVIAVLSGASLYIRKFPGDGPRSTGNG
jgi:hypothetical protein